MATGKIITQTANGCVKRSGAYHVLYVVRIYEGNIQKSYKKKQRALDEFRKLDQAALNRHTMRLQQQRLQQTEYGQW